MRIVTLVENTSISSEYKCKHGLSFYIETEKHKILFDLGSDSLFLKNAQRLGVNISAVDTVVISHGHKDHGGALEVFMEINSKAKIYIRDTAFQSHYTKVLGIPFNVGLNKKLINKSQVVLTGESYIIDDELQVFSGVKERECYSTSNNALFTRTSQGMVLDDFSHEQSLIISENGKHIMFSGCAHSGIVNILNKGEKLIGDNLSTVISGFHLYNPVSKKKEDDNLVAQISKRLTRNKTKYYTCHCTGEKAFQILRKTMNEKIDYLSTGSSIEI